MNGKVIAKTILGIGIDIAVYSAVDIMVSKMIIDRKVGKSGKEQERKIDELEAEIKSIKRYVVNKSEEIHKEVIEDMAFVRRSNSNSIDAKMVDLEKLTMKKMNEYHSYAMDQIDETFERIEAIEKYLESNKDLTKDQDNKLWEEVAAQANKNKVEAKKGAKKKVKKNEENVVSKDVSDDVNVNENNKSVE